ncbi:MAG: tRNA pseudouridine(55) synthase TruB [Dermabacter sp.]|nr:tRNA pseudouridine(55) synthase TruB [Dermabacter sp.]
MSTAPAAPVGVVLVDKPRGMTSHDVVSRLRYHLRTKKVGHAGTLDPMATGLLVLGVGGATKLLTYAVGLDKTYEATIRLGAATVTDDAEGEMVGDRAPAAALDAISDERLEEAIGRLRGSIMQVPSAVSAIKVGGERSYARVRAGREVELAARPIEVTRFEVTAVRRVAGEGEAWVDIDAVIDCSSGTYIRALARDLGADLGVGGHLTALRRTRVGGFHLEAAQPVPERGAPRADEDPASALTLQPPAAFASQLLPVHPVGPDEARTLRYGQWITPGGAPAPASWPAAAIDEAAQDLVALVEPASDGRLKPALVFAAPQPGPA